MVDVDEPRLAAARQPDGDRELVRARLERRLRSSSAPSIEMLRRTCPAPSSTRLRGDEVTARNLPSVDQLSADGVTSIGVRHTRRPLSAFRRTIAPPE